MSKIINLTTEDFEQETKEGVAFVAFWAPWCGPCRMMAPVYEEVANESEDFKICKVNTDEAQELAVKYGVRSIPTLLFMKDGEVKESLMGAQHKTTILDTLDGLKEG